MKDEFARDCPLQDNRELNDQTQVDQPRGKEGDLPLLRSLMIGDPGICLRFLGKENTEDVPGAGARLHFPLRARDVG
eukprot:14287546-Heterocapsa_arctica.AAC.1